MEAIPTYGHSTGDTAETILDFIFGYNAVLYREVSIDPVRVTVDQDCPVESRSVFKLVKEHLPCSSLHVFGRATCRKQILDSQVRKYD